MIIDTFPNISIMKAYIYILICLIFTLPGFAGNSDKYPIRWNKISEAEFQVKPTGRDSTAAAIVLCDFGNIEVSNRTFYSRHTRIKVLNKEGLRYATVEIPFQSREHHDEFTNTQSPDPYHGKRKDQKLQGHLFANGKD